MDKLSETLPRNLDADTEEKEASRRKTMVPVSPRVRVKAPMFTDIRAI